MRSPMDATNRCVVARSRLHRLVDGVRCSSIHEAPPDSSRSKCHHDASRWLVVAAVQWLIDCPNEGVPRRSAMAKTACRHEPLHRAKFIPSRGVDVACHASQLFLGFGNDTSLIDPDRPCSLPTFLAPTPARLASVMTSTSNGLLLCVAATAHTAVVEPPAPTRPRGFFISRHKHNTHTKDPHNATSIGQSQEDAVRKICAAGALVYDRTWPNRTIDKAPFGARSTLRDGIRPHRPDGS